MSDSVMTGADMFNIGSDAKIIIKIGHVVVGPGGDILLRSIAVQTCLLQPPRTCSIT